MALGVCLGAGPSPAELVRRAAGEPGLVALVGDWFDGTALVASRPVQTTTDPAELDGRESSAGGWFGTVAHDGAAHFGWYDHVLRHRDGQWWFDGPAAARARWRALLDGADDGATSRAELGLDTLPARSGHLAAVERAVELIRAGELYQVNVCTRLGGPFAGASAALFAELVTGLRPARAALVTTGGRTLVSASPELFVELRGRTVRTSPIKGTLPRASGDDGNRERLRASAKDAAENVMIVDLLRNDLGRVCDTGSVRVEALLGVEPHPGVWHLVSTVRGRLRSGVGVAGLLAATLPPGSVTGAPKLRAVAAIDDLEAVPRGAYTGVVGAVLGDRAEFAVAIRSFEIADGRWQLGVGGGVTADSVPMSEWRECGHKAAPLLHAAGLELPTEPVPMPPDDRALLETLLAVDGRVLRLGDHLARLDRSARELTGHGLPDGLRDDLQRAAASVPGRAVLRVVLREGTATVTAAPAAPPPLAVDVRTVVRPAGLWRHKWADRSLLDPTGGPSGGPADGPPDEAEPLFVADDGTVLETLRGNVFLLRGDGTLATPPLRDDLLPGVTRRAVLDLARDTGRPVELREFGLDELRGNAAFRTSSLSGAVPISSVDEHRLPRADAAVTSLSRALFGGPGDGR